MLKIRARWEQALEAPAAPATFLDLAAPGMQDALETARGTGYPKALARDASLDLLLAGAYVRNPGLAAAGKRWSGTVEQFAQVSHLDNILRQYASFLRSSKTAVGSALPGDALAARFPFPGALELKAALVGHAVEEARARYEIVLGDLVTDVRVAHAEQVFVAQSITNTRETLGYLRQLEETARGMLSAGRAGKAHVIQTQVQISQLENDLLTLERQQDTLRARLAAFVNLPTTAPIGDAMPSPVPPVPGDLVALQARARRAQPEILAATARAARMATMIELAELTTYPALSPGLSAMEGLSHATGGSSKEREPFQTTPRIRPDPWFGSKEAYLREAREGARAAQLEVTAAQDRTAFRVTEAHNQLETARRLHELYRDVQLAQARQAYEDSSAGYAADRTEFLAVIDALRQWLRFRLDGDRAVRDVHQTQARLERALGGPVLRAGTSDSAGPQPGDPPPAPPAVPGAR